MFSKYVFKSFVVIIVIFSMLLTPIMPAVMAQTSRRIISTRDKESLILQEMAPEPSEEGQKSDLLEDITQDNAPQEAAEPERIEAEDKAQDAAMFESAGNAQDAQTIPESETREDEYQIFIPIIFSNSSETPPQGPDLSISKTADVSTVAPGGTIIYTLAYQNLSDSPASGVILSDTLPDFSSFDADNSTTGWVQVGETSAYQFDLGAVDNLSSGEIAIAIIVSPDIGSETSSITNTASISHDGTPGEDPILSNNTDSAVTTVEGVEPFLDLAITLSSPPEPVNPGDLLIFEIDYENSGNLTASGVLMTAHLPSFTSFDSENSTSSWTYDEAEDVYTYDLGSLDPAQSGSLAFAVIVDDTLAAGVESIFSSFEIADDGSQGADSTPANNSAGGELALDAAPDLSLTITEDSTYVQPGDLIIYDLTYANVGDQDATGVVLVATLPENTIFDPTNSTPGWEVIVRATDYQLTLGSLSAEASGSAQFAVIVDETVPSGTTSIPLSASAADDGSNGEDPNSDNNDAQEETPYSEAPDLKLSKTGAGTVQLGMLQIYTLTYENIGYNTASNVIITETVPEYTTFNADQSDPGWTQVGTTDQYTFAIPNLEKDAFGEITFAVSIDSSIPDGVIGIRNTATIADDGLNGSDPDLSNNTAEFDSIFSEGVTEVCGTISEDTTWTPAKSPYVLTCDVTVDPGVNLTIQPGTIVKFNSSTRQLIIKGSLTAEGISSSKIHFTSYYDDNVGGDTNGDGNATSPTAGDWNQVDIYSGGSATFEYVEMRYGGADNPEGMIFAQSGSSLSVTNSVLEHSRYYGIVTNNESPVIIGNTISDCPYDGIHIFDAEDAVPITPEVRDNVINNSGWRPIEITAENDGLTGTRTITNNTGSGNTYNGILIRGKFVGTTVLSADNGFYWLFTSSTVTIISGATLTLDPGSVVKKGVDTSTLNSLRVYGTLVAIGTPSAPITFTSSSDGEGRTPEAGDWDAVEIYSGGSATFEYVEMRYGSADNEGMISAHSGSSLSVTNSVLEHSKYHGIGVSTSNHLISINRFNNIGSYAVYNADTTNIQVKAENNWWGDDSGPDPYGSGEGINYRTCRDPDTGEYYICEYYVDTVPWIGQEYSDSEDLINEELPPEPDRNTAPMEAGVPYIEYVKSQHGFFYFNEESVDLVEISVDWNGSDSGTGEPGIILINLEGSNLVELDASDTLSTYSLNVGMMPKGRSNFTFIALAHEALIVSEFYNVYAMKINLPPWIHSMMATTGPFNFSIDVKPEYTEAKAGIKIPSITEKYEMTGFDLFNNPVYEKIKLPVFEIKGDISLRTDGIGSISGKTKLGEATSLFDDIGATDGKFYFVVEADGDIDFSESYFEVTGTVGVGSGGEVKYRYPIISLLGGPILIELAEMPLLKQVLKAVYLQAKVNPEFTIDMDYSASEQEEKVHWDSLYFDGDIKSTIGLGFSIITDGFLNMEFYGGGTIEPEFCLIPELEWKQMSGSFLVGTKISAFYMYELVDEYKWPMETIKGPAYYICGGTDSESNQINIQPTDLESFNDVDKQKLSIEHPDYGGSIYSQFLDKKTTQNIQSDSLNSTNGTILISNLYRNASPSIASRGDNKMIMWVHDDISLPDAQSKELVYSIHDLNGWTTPIQLTDNLMVDHSPSIAFIDDTHILAIWEQINDSTISDDSTFTSEVAKKVEILYAFYDFENESWTSPEYLTSNTSLDARSRIKVGNDGTVMVYWIKNSGGDMFGTSQFPSQIMSAIWNGSEWIEYQVTSQSIMGLLSYEVGVNNLDDADVVYSSDGTGEFTNLEYSEIFWLDWDGSNWSNKIQLTDNNLMDDSPYINYMNNGEKWLFWNQDGNIKVLKNDWSTTPISTTISDDNSLLRTYKIASDENENLIVVWQSYSESGSDLYISFFDALSDTWKLQEQLTSSLDVERQFDLSFNNDQTVDIVYLYDNLSIIDKIIGDETYSNIINFESSDLHVLHYTPDSDMTVEDLSLPYRPNPEPGETVVVQAMIVNSGDWSVENPSISFFDGDPASGGILINRYDHLGFVAAGTSVTAEVDWLVPADSTTSHTIYAVVDPDGLIDEKDENNNQESLVTILPDLKVSSVSSYYYDQNTVIPLVVIYNNGKLNAENILVEFREGAVDGPIVYSEVIPILEKENTVAVSTEINVSSWGIGTYKYFVTVDSNNEILEVEEENNSDYFSIAVLPDLVIYAGDIIATLEEEVGGAVNVTLRNWGTTIGENITVNLYEGPEIDLTKTPIQSWTVPTLAVDGVTILSTNIDFIPHHLFAVADPDNMIEEIDKSNNVAFEDLPVVHGSHVTVVGNSDPNLADIIYTPAEFDDNTGSFDLAVEANLYDVSTIVDTPYLCDISMLIDFTDLDGRIALIEKTDLCAYDVQVNNAGSLGAVGVLIFNDETGGNIRETMKGEPVTIPAGFLPHQDGLDLSPYHDQLIRIAPEDEAVTIFDPYR
jgi:uncharacterized repeat protein (TIGR01451 family)